MGAIGIIIRGTGKLPWGHKQLDTVLGRCKGLVGTLHRQGTLLQGLLDPGVGRGIWGGGRASALPVPGQDGGKGPRPLPHGLCGIGIPLWTICLNRAGAPALLHPMGVRREVSDLSPFCKNLLWHLIGPLPSPSL